MLGLAVLLLVAVNHRLQQIHILPLPNRCCDQRQKERKKERETVRQRDRQRQRQRATGEQERVVHV